MKRAPARSRFRIAALLPAVLVALALSAWHAHTRLSEIESQTLAHTSALARQFAALAAPDMQADDRDRLRATAQAVLEHYPAIAGMTVTDARGRLLARAGRAPNAARVGGAEGGSWPRIEHAIGGGSGDALGRLALAIDLSALDERRSAIVLESAGLAGLTMLLSALITAGFGSSAPVSPRLVPRPLPRLRAAGRPLGRWGIPLRSPEPTAPSQLAARVARLQDDNSRLEAARREAEAASARKSRYLADISHEIRTPMNAILGFTELLEREDQRVGRSDYLRTVRESVAGLLGLLNSMLDLSKAESGHLELDYADTDLNALLAEMFRLFAPQTFAKQVELLVAPVEPAHARVRVDAMRLKQVLVNLVSNAVRFTDAGHVRIAATVTPHAEGALRVRFTVDDSGCGIPESARPHLFEAFAQGHGGGDDARAPALDAGTGLGLSIASELVELMGGRIAFDTARGQGSSFWFELMLEPAQQGRQADASRRPRRRIALLDPDALTRDCYADLLGQAGLDAEYATDGAAVLRAHAVDPIDAILVHVPARTEAHGPPRLDPRLAQTNVPVLTLVHQPDSAFRHALWQAGHRRLLAKSADPAVLRKSFDHAVASRPPEVAVFDTTAADLAPAAPDRRVLIIDDCGVNQRLLAEFARGAGFDAQTASGSDEALRLAGEQAFAAILTDMRLPERDGAEIARLLRTGEGPNRHTPIIAVTADVMAGQANRALRAGIDDVLIKPITGAALAECLRLWAPAGGHEPGERHPVVDPAEATRRASGKADLARELFDTLCRSLPKTRAILARARAEGDTALARAEAHRLQGAVTYCGVPRLEMAVLDLRQATREEDAHALDDALARVDRRIGEVLAYAKGSDPDCTQPASPTSRRAEPPGASV